MFTVDVWVDVADAVWVDVAVVRMGHVLHSAGHSAARDASPQLVFDSKAHCAGSILPLHFLSHVPQSTKHVALKIAPIAGFWHFEASVPHVTGSSRPLQVVSLVVVVVVVVVMVVGWQNLHFTGQLFRLASPLVPVSLHSVPVTSAQGPGSGFPLHSVAGSSVVVAGTVVVVTHVLHSTGQELLKPAPRIGCSHIEASVPQARPSGLPLHDGVGVLVVVVVVVVVVEVVVHVSHRAGQFFRKVGPSKGWPQNSASAPHVALSWFPLQ